jgi:hypothetical protein
MPVTGLLPRRPETREMLASEHLFAAAEVRRETIIQPIAWIRDQRAKPSCVGHAFAAGVDAHLGTPPWCSAVDLWEDARRRQGNVEGVLSGTRAEYVIASLMKRGWSPYHEGEDSRPVGEDADGRGSSLCDELYAHDTRQLGVVHYDISRDRTGSVIEALKAGYAVGGGWGLADKFFTARGRDILDPSYLNTHSNGHEMRIFAYFEPLRAFGLQNSWSHRQSAFTVGGVTYEGCVLITEESLEVAWDIDALEIRP